MSYEDKGAYASDIGSCRYGASRLSCRGPLRDPQPGYVAFLGGSETYGKFVDTPYVGMLEQDLGRDCINLGCANTGLDAYLQDRDLLNLARGADLAVVQIMGVQNLSNPFYRVHPRRNDRFVAPTPRLAALYPEVDFTEFHFNKHLLATLERVSPKRFLTVQDVLRRCWAMRMRQLTKRLRVPLLMVWLRYDCMGDVRCGPRPLLVTREMLAALGAPVVEVPVGTSLETGDLAQMNCAPFESPAAGQLIGPAMHRIIADRVLPEIRALLA